MAKIISHQYWLQLTNAGTLSIRGLTLRAIDNALERYHQQPTTGNLTALKAAFAAYTASEPQWLKSPRNRYRAFEILQHDLSGTSTLQLTPAERVAWKLIYDESQAALQKLFQGKSLEWRTGLSAKLSKQRNGLIENSYDLTKNSLALANQHPMEMAKKLFDDIVPAEVRSIVAQALQLLLPKFMQDLAASIAPFLGIGYSAYNLVKASAEAISSEIKLSQSRQHAQQAFCTNEPALATQALLRILDRECTSAKFAFALNATSFTAKLATAVADGGTVGNAAIGVASSVASLINILRVITIDCLERQAANRHMGRHQITPEIFDACPIIGAYMICCVPASALMNALFEEQAVVGWTGKAEHAWKNHWMPLRETARDLIKEHRFVIPALERHPGVITPNHEALQAKSA
jgi:hypothetical protein